MIMRLTLTLLAGLGLSAACAAAQPPAERDPMAAAGQNLAERHCGECHAVTGDTSPFADAPPFSSLAEKRNLAAFPQAYADGFFEGHPRMPLVQLDPDELAELTAFLKSIDSGR